MAISDMSQAQIESRIEAGDRAQAKLDRQKADGEKLGRKVATIAGAALAGGVYGLLNRRQGGNYYQPYSVAGRVPLDTVAGLGGAALILFGESTEEGLLEGAAAGLIGIAASRYGDNYQANLMSGGAPPPPAMASGPMNFRHAHMTGGSNRFPHTTRQPAYGVGRF
jgi:hypothetical protein